MTLLGKHLLEAVLGLGVLERGIVLEVTFLRAGPISFSMAALRSSPAPVGALRTLASSASSRWIRSCIRWMPVRFFGFSSPPASPSAGLASGFGSAAGSACSSPGVAAVSKGLAWWPSSFSAARESSPPAACVSAGAPSTIRSSSICQSMKKPAALGARRVGTSSRPAPHALACGIGVDARSRPRRAARVDQPEKGVADGACARTPRDM